MDQQINTTNQIIPTLLSDIAVNRQDSNYLLTAWTVLAAIVSLAGNSVFLIASMAYNAIKLDKTSVIFLRNLAISDCGFFIYTFLDFLIKYYPPLDSYDMSLFVQLLGQLFIGVDILMVCALSVSKLMTLKYPFVERRCSKSVGRVVSIAVWSFTILLLTIELALIVLDRQRTESDALTILGHQRSTQKTVGSTTLTRSMVYTNVLHLLAIIVPFTTICTATTWLFLYVRKVRDLQNQSVFVIILVSSVFTVSYMPHFIYRIMVMFRVNGIADSLFSDISYYLIYVNFAADPLVYLITIRSFRKFVIRRPSRKQLVAPTLTVQR